MKNLLLLITLVLGAFSINAQQVVDLGTYPTFDSVEKFSGLSNVKVSVNQNGTYRFFIETGDTNSVIEQARALGIRATIGSLNAFSCLCRGDAPQISREELAKLRNLFFGFDSSSLTRESRGKLNSLIDVLKRNPGYTVKFYGHTDGKGTSEYNEALSQRRVNSARSYLTTRGINSGRIGQSTYGEAQPIAQNTESDAGRKFNRRVEIQIFDNNGNLIDLVEDIYVPANLK